MPRAMTPDEARKKICPFMTRRLPDVVRGNIADEAVRCHADQCACWGWVDRNDGQQILTGKTIVTPASSLEPSEPAPDGYRWQYHETSQSQGTRTWVLMRIKGARRGRCEASAC